MRNVQRILSALSGVFVLAALYTANAQTPPSSAAQAGQAFTADYPNNRAGVMIQSIGWTDVTNQFPVKTKAAHSIAAGLSYGMVPAKLVAEYDGEHAPTQTEAVQPILCICHMISLPGAPVIVRLHPKKGARELDGGKMVVYPVVGGSKMADANKTDLIPVDVSQPESQVWLVRPQVELQPGEYALMLGTQNVSIFPFTVTSPSSNPGK